jgi:hypothetical protein
MSELLTSMSEFKIIQHFFRKERLNDFSHDYNSGAIAAIASPKT